MPPHTEVSVCLGLASQRKTRQLADLAMQQLCIRNMGKVVLHPVAAELMLPNNEQLHLFVTGQA